MSNEQPSFKDLIRKKYRKAIHAAYRDNEALLKAVDNMSDAQFDEDLDIDNLIDRIEAEIDLFASDANCYVDCDE